MGSVLETIRIRRRDAFAAVAAGAIAGFTDEPETLVKTAFGAVGDVSIAAYGALFPPESSVESSIKTQHQSLEKRIAATRSESQVETVSHPELYRNMQLGFSYAVPEKGFQMDGKYGAVAGLDRIFKEGIFSHVRFEMPWVTPNGENTQRLDGTVDTKQIEPFLQLAIQHGVTPCINVGPIKYFRWPEDNKQPATLFKNEGIPKPPHGKEIALDSPFGQRAMEFFINELQALRKIIPPGYPANIQIDNESHHPFGENKWTISQEMLLQEALYANAYFPESKILLNSAERNDANFIIDTFKKLKERNPDFNGRYVLGIDFYSFFDKGNDLYTYDKQDKNDKNPSWEEIKLKAKENGIEIEITELQAEAWGQPQLLQKQSLKFNIGWCVENIVNANNPYVVNLWGAELLAVELAKNPPSEKVQKILKYLQSLRQLAA